MPNTHNWNNEIPLFSQVSDFSSQSSPAGSYLPFTSTLNFGLPSGAPSRSGGTTSHSGTSGERLPPLSATHHLTHQQQQQQQQSLHLPTHLRPCPPTANHPSSSSSATSFYPTVNSPANATTAKPYYVSGGVPALHYKRTYNDLPPPPVPAYDASGLNDLGKSHRAGHVPFLFPASRVAGAAPRPPALALALAHAAPAPAAGAELEPEEARLREPRWADALVRRARGEPRTPWTPPPRTGTPQRNGLGL